MKLLRGGGKVSLGMVCYPRTSSHLFGSQELLSVEMDWQNCMGKVINSYPKLHWIFSHIISLSFSESLCCGKIKEQQPAIHNSLEVMGKTVTVAPWKQFFTY